MKTLQAKGPEQSLVSRKDQGIGSRCVRAICTSLLAQGVTSDVGLRTPYQTFCKTCCFKPEPLCLIAEIRSSPQLVTDLGMPLTAAS